MKIGFIGAGKVGMALGLYLLKNGFNITGYYSRSVASAKKAALLTSCRAYKTLEDLPRDSDLIFITVNDDQIERVDKDLAATTSINKRHIIAHTSGAHGSDLLKELKGVGCSVYSIHPLQSFSEPERTVIQLDTTVFTLEGDNNKLEIIKNIFIKTHNRYFVINKELKPLYHAGACIASNYLVTLMNFAFDYFEEAGINRKDIFTAIAPLIYGTLDNISNIGTIQALTGPLVRKDVKTIDSHIQTIEQYLPETLDFYKYLGLETLHMVDGKRMSSDEVELLNNLLRKEVNDE